MNAPLGQTGTETPLMSSPASPLPTDPKMKLESRDAMSCPDLGYVIEISSAPRTSGTGGSLGLAGGSGAFAITGMAGTGAERGDGVQAARSSAQQAKPLIFQAVMSFSSRSGVMIRLFSYYAWVVPCR